MGLGLGVLSGCGRAVGKRIGQGGVCRRWSGRVKALQSGDSDLKNNENLIFAIIFNTSTMYVDKAHSKRSNFFKIL